MIESALRHETGSPACLLSTFTSRNGCLTLNLRRRAVLQSSRTAPFLGRDCFQFFFVNHSKLKCVFICVCLCTPCIALLGSAISRTRALRKFLFSGNVGENSVQKASGCEISILLPSLCLYVPFLEIVTCEHTSQFLLKDFL